tara:strand:- start:102 stop:425 length:324 start_codon:yes stop_codon:yes gene_type:complete
MSKTIYILIFYLLVSACATSYTFAPRYEGSLGDNKYELSFRGNSYTSEEKLKSYWNKRAAKICAASNNDVKILSQRTEAVGYEDRTYADFGKSVDMELRVFGVFECI